MPILQLFCIILKNLKNYCKKKSEYATLNLINYLIHLKITGRKNINQSSLFTKQEEHGKERTKAMCILKEIQNTNL